MKKALFLLLAVATLSTVKPLSTYAQQHTYVLDKTISLPCGGGYDYLQGLISNKLLIKPVLY